MEVPVPIQPVTTQNAPKAIGPYSQAVIANGFVFCSGQIALSPIAEGVVGNTAEEQAIQVLENLKAVLEAAGSAMSRVVKTTVFLKDLNDFADVNSVYARAFGDHRPARATVEVSRLPKNVLVEIDCVAVV